jgi:hypothetical protein
MYWALVYSLLLLKPLLPLAGFSSPQPQSSPPTTARCCWPPPGLLPAEPGRLPLAPGGGTAEGGGGV